MVGVHRGNKQGRDRGDPERKTSKMPPGGHLRPLGGGFLITVAAHKCGLHRGKCCNYIFVHGLCLSAQMRIASRPNSAATVCTSTLPQRTHADCIQIVKSISGLRLPLPQRTHADCIYLISILWSVVCCFASAHTCGLHPVSPDVDGFPIVALPQRTHADCI